MKIAITGGTGFVGRHIARWLAGQGHEVVVLARGIDRTDLTIHGEGGIRIFRGSLDDPAGLAPALEGCSTVIHCAGINRETAGQTFENVHVRGTQNLVQASKMAGIRRLVLLSFLRARPACGSGYHESKWAAEETIRQSGMDYTILKCGVIYGAGDHMLNHLSRAFYTLPLFAFVGWRDRPVRPVAVEDVARIAGACVADGALPRCTVAVVGPEELSLRQAVRRVADVAGRHPLMFPMPVWFHRLLAWGLERVMTTPLVSAAQIRILSEGVADPEPPCAPMPQALAPHIAFTPDQIRKGLPPPGPFTRRDLRVCRKLQARSGTKRCRRVFFEMP